MAETSQSRPILELQDISKRYEPAGEAEGPLVLEHLDLTVSEGQSLAVVGPSGSGKSTLLNIAGTLDRPTAGNVFLEGTDLSQLGDRELATIRNRRLGFVFQLHHLLPQCTIWENVLVPTLAGVRPQGPEDVEDRAFSLLERVGLQERLSHRPGQLSGGERQRVAVIRALINQPKLLLADEPTGSLDRVSAERLIELLVKLNQEQKVALVVVTHSMALARRMGQVMTLRDGKLLETVASTQGSIEAR